MSLVVVKCGGAVAAVAAAGVRGLVDDGNQVCVVHGAGPQISAEMERLGLAVRFIHGRRVTEAAALAVVRESLAGVNARLCEALGPDAVGFMGDEIGIEARRISKLGLVGEPLPSSPPAVSAALASGRIPVIAPLARGPLNVNADEAAWALAVGLGARRLLFPHRRPRRSRRGSPPPLDRGRRGRPTARRRLVPGWHRPQAARGRAGRALGRPRGDRRDGGACRESGGRLTGPPDLPALRRHLRGRRRCAPHGRRRLDVPRLCRRHRGRRPRARAPRRRRGGAPSARPALARLQPLLDRAHGRPCGPALRAVRRGAGLLLQLRRRGGGGSSQIRAQGDWQARRGRARGLLPRAYPRRPRGHRAAGEAAGIRAAAGPGLLRAPERRRLARGRDRAGDGARHPGAGARRGRRRPARARVPGGGGRARGGARRAAGLRRDPDRRGEDRDVLRLGAGGRAARRSSRSPRVSPTASRSAVCSSPTRRRAGSSRAITPRRSVGTRSPVRRRAPSATRSTKTSLPALGGAARSCGPGSVGSAPSGSRAAAASSSAPSSTDRRVRWHRSASSTGSW